MGPRTYRVQRVPALALHPTPEILDTLERWLQ